jgi:MFS family permease
VVAARHIGATPHITGAALLIAASALALGGAMLGAEADAAPESSSFARPTPVLVTLGIVAFSVLFGEGAMADWSAVYLRDVNGAGPGLAAAGYASFSLTMATGRFIGDALIVRLGARRMVRGGGALAALGLLVAIVGAHPWASIVGFGAVGAGLSNIFPTVLATAGRLEGQSAGPAIAAVSTLGYAGFLAGPPLIGFVAEGATLRGGLALVVASCLVVASLAGSLRHARRSS